MSEPPADSDSPDPHELLEVLPVHPQPHPAEPKPVDEAQFTGQDRLPDRDPRLDEPLDVLPVDGPPGQDRLPDRDPRLNEPLDVLPADSPAAGVTAANVPSWHIGFWIALVVVLTVWMGMIFTEGELQLFALAGLETVPFLLLALVSYVGKNHDWAKIVTVALLGLLALVMTLLNIFIALLPGRIEYGLTLQAPMALRYLLLSLSGSMLAMVLGAVCYLPPVRRFLARPLGFESASFVHATALAVVVGMTAALLVPLLAVGMLPIDLLPAADGEDFDQAEVLRGRMYGLMWLVPAAFLAVGYPLRRNFLATVDRLAFVLPSWKQVIFAVVAGFVLVPVFLVVGNGLTWLWERWDWTTTKQTSVEESFNPLISPMGAVVIGVVAGLGEELVFRGMLQPRLGILLSNLFFTALHALQYHFDVLLVVFMIGLILGFIRKYSNTSTAAIVHGGYDFWLILATYLQIRGFT